MEMLYFSVPFSASLFEKLFSPLPGLPPVRCFTLELDDVFQQRGHLSRERLETAHFLSQRSKLGRFFLARFRTCVKWCPFKSQFSLSVEQRFDLSSHIALCLPRMGLEGLVRVRESLLFALLDVFGSTQEGLAVVGGGTGWLG